VDPCLILKFVSELQAARLKELLRISWNISTPSDLCFQGLNSPQKNWNVSFKSTVRMSQDKLANKDYTNYSCSDICCYMGSFLGDLGVILSNYLPVLQDLVRKNTPWGSLHTPNPDCFAAWPDSKNTTAVQSLSDGRWPFRLVMTDGHRSPWCFTQHNISTESGGLWIINIFSLDWCYSPWDFT